MHVDICFLSVKRAGAHAKSCLKTVWGLCWFNWYELWWLQTTFSCMFLHLEFPSVSFQFHDWHICKVFLLQMNFDDIPEFEIYSVYSCCLSQFPNDLPNSVSENFKNCQLLQRRVAQVLWMRMIGVIPIALGFCWMHWKNIQIGRLFAVKCVSLELSRRCLRMQRFSHKWAFA